MPSLQAWCLRCAQLLCSPNVDFYSGIVLRALGIPLSMYTVLFAVARTVGWVSQVSNTPCMVASWNSVLPMYKGSDLPHCQSCSTYWICLDVAFLTLAKSLLDG